MSMRHLPVLKERQKTFSKSWQHSIFLGPVMTQKAFNNTQQRVYTVKVHKDASKIAIRKAFKALFDVEPASVNTVILPGKVKRKKMKAGSGYREVKVQAPVTKKAMIRIPDGVQFDFGDA